MDLYADPAVRDDVSPFVEMLWRRARAHEEEVIDAKARAFLNISAASAAEREQLTVEAMSRREPLIFGGRISYGDLLGEPDILRLDGEKYLPGDIKSGAAEEGPSGGDRKPKIHYAIQLALYADILEHLGFSAGRRGFVWDVHGEEVEYDLAAPKGQKMLTSLWDDYQSYLLMAKEILSGERHSSPASSASCKQCWWYTACVSELEKRDDLTLLPELGRSRRESLLAYVQTISEFADRSPATFLDEKGKSLIKGLGADSIAKFQARAALRVSGGSPYLKSALTLPNNAVELFFDIETDPMRDHCYLHGFIERRDRDSAHECYVGFFSEEPTALGEREAFAKAWKYVESTRPSTLYIYSKYERTWWRALQRKYPEVCSADEIEDVFAPSTTVDLYEIIQTQTEWPTNDYSLKTLAKFLGFSWRDAHPSGAASIEWYDRYVRGDASAKERILLYNEDDCVASRVVLDGVLDLQSLA